MANRNFPQAFSIQNKDFTAILKSRIFAQKFEKIVAIFFNYVKFGGRPHENGLKN